MLARDASAWWMHNWSDGGGGINSLARPPRVSKGQTRGRAPLYTARAQHKDESCHSRSKLQIALCMVMWQSMADPLIAAAHYSHQPPPPTYIFISISSDPDWCGWREMHIHHHQPECAYWKCHRAISAREMHLRCECMHYLMSRASPIDLLLFFVCWQWERRSDLAQTLCTATLRARASNENKVHVGGKCEAPRRLLDLFIC
jgi:hypothetical protein